MKCFNRLIPLLLLSSAVSGLSHATDYYLATDGKDIASNDGTIKKPYQTTAFLLSKKDVVAGDNIF